MSDYRIALPRAINLGPHKKVAMSDLRALMEDLGFEECTTILNSGNLVFRSTLGATKLEGMLEDAAAKDLGLDTEFMVRTGAEWKKIVSGNPFRKIAKDDPSHLMVHFCKKAAPKGLEAKGANREEFAVVGKQIYVTYPDGIGRSTFDLGLKTTARNWNTVLKLANLTS